MENSRKKITLVIVIALMLTGVVVGGLYLLISSLGGGTLNITSEPKNINVYINNKKYASPARISLKAGTYLVWGSQEGYEVYKQRVAVKSLGKNNLVIKLTPLVTAGPPGGEPLLGSESPKIQNLPHKTAHYSIQWRADLNKYFIVPEIPFDGDANPYDELSRSWPQYDAYGKEALEWLRSQGVTPTNDNIGWWAEEWWPAGKTML